MQSGRRERHAVVRPNGPGESELAEEPLDVRVHRERLGGAQGLAGEQAPVSLFGSRLANRAFEHLTPDGTIDCYGPTILSNRSSWFIALTSATNLSIELVTHAFGASPCLADPSTWAFGSARVLMVR